MTDQFKAFFNNIASQYQPLTRYSVETLDCSLDRFLKYLPSECASVLDLGAGDGYPASRLMAKHPRLHLSLLDLSFEMIKAAQVRFARANPTPRFILADLNDINFEGSSFDGALSCCTLQFVREITAFLQKIRSALLPNGIVCLLFYDPEDLRCQLIHKYFPGLHAIEQLRHYPDNKVCLALKSVNFSIIHTEVMDYHIVYSGAPEYLNFIDSRPFSGFAQMPDEVYRKSFQIFSAIIRKLFPYGSIHSPGRLRLIIARR